MKKIVLTIPPPTPRFTEFGEDSVWGYWQPLGLLSVASYLKNNIPDLSILILDEQVLSYGEIADSVLKYSPDILGICPTLANYGNSLALARLGKEIGCKTVFGGPYASCLGKSILLNRPYVDYVVVEDGEEAMTGIVRGIPDENIPNLIWRSFDDRIKCNKINVFDLNNMPFIDFSLLESMEPYYKNYINDQKKKDPFQPFRRPATIVSQKGCMWRGKTKGGCIFCSCIYPLWRSKNPESVWNEAKKLVREYHVDCLLFGEDDFTASHSWFNEFFRKRPEDLSINIRFIHARADSLDEDTIKKLSELGCYQILVGLESSNDSCLQALQKGVNLNKSLKAIENLKKHNIKPLPSFVVGAPGETEQTLENTFSLAKKMKEEGIEQFRVFPLFPGPGSKSWHMLMSKSPDFRRIFYDNDLLDYDIILSLWVRNFCHVSIEKIIETSLKIFSLNSMYNRGKHFKTKS